MKKQLNEEILRNIELMNININENTANKIAKIVKKVYNKALDKIEDFLDVDDKGEVDVTQDTTDIDNDEIDLENEKDVEKLKQVYQDESDNEVESENSEILKKFLESEGMGIRPGVFSAGDMDKESVVVFKTVLKSLKNKAPEIKIEVTSGNDIFHELKGGNSRHKTGNALDFIFTPKNENTTNKLYEVFCEARKKINGFTFLDEYRQNLGGSGKHMHISFKPNNEEPNYLTKKICDEINVTEDESSDTY